MPLRNFHTPKVDRDDRDARNYKKEFFNTKRVFPLISVQRTCSLTYDNTFFVRILYGPCCRDQPTRITFPLSLLYKSRRVDQGKTSFVNRLSTEILPSAAMSTRRILVKESIENLFLYHNYYYSKCFNCLCSYFFGFCWPFWL